MHKSSETPLSKEEKQPALPPFIPDGDHYICTNKKKPFWEGVVGLGAGWGFAVALGSIINLCMGLSKPSGAPSRFKNLVLSSSPWRQTLDAAGMATGATVMAVEANQHNKKIDSYAHKIRSERALQEHEQQQTR